MAILLIQRRPTTTSPFQHVDTSLLLFFAGLFIVTASFQASITAQSLYTTLTHTLDNNLTHLGIISTVLANVISNVPAVILLSPIVTQFEAPQAAWLMLSASATLAGNTTLLASVANLIVAERAAQHGVALPFGAYLRIGFPVTILSIGIALALLG
jgi:Na+/H+ antiporter NhaD/arsenite permease-like protein